MLATQVAEINCTTSKGGRVISASTKRWVLRLLGGLFVLLLIGFVVRSALLPAETACVFLDYEEGASWVRAPESPLFQDHELEFAGREPIQVGGQDLGAWDEVAIVNFESTADYGAFLARIAAEKSLARYHLMELTPNPPEFLFFLNRQLRSYRGDDSIDPGGSAPLEDVIPDETYAQRWRDLFRGPYRDAVVVLNLLVHEENPQDPAGVAESDATSEELFERYKEKALRVLGKMGAQIAVAGTVDGVVVGPELRDYDEYGFAFYPSVAAFETVFTAQERVDARVDQHAALSAERSMGYWTKPYEEFTPEGK